MNETNDPPPAGPDILSRLLAVETATARTADVLSANVRAVELLGRRHFDLVHRLAALERSLAKRDAVGG